MTQTEDMVRLRQEGFGPREILEKLQKKYPNLNLRVVYNTTAPSRIARMTNEKPKRKYWSRRPVKTMPSMIELPALTGKAVMFYGSPKELAEIARDIAL